MVILTHLKDRIEKLISQRLENSVTLFEVSNWLQNFEKNEAELAVSLLEKFEFFSVNRIVSIYNDGLKKIFSKSSEKFVIFLAIGEFAKSGTAMTYYLSQSPLFKDSRYKKKKVFAKSLDDIVLIIKENTVPFDEFLLVLVDDFIGSGKSTLEFYEGKDEIPGLKHILGRDNLTPRIAVLSIIILDEGKKRLERNIDNVYISAELRAKVFSPASSIFGYRPKMIPIREMCYQYGIRLSKASNALGFDNSQAMIAFSHTTPNNTLPIFWSSVGGWYPLFPRFGKDKIQRFKKFRSDSNYWLSVAQNAKIVAFDTPGILHYNTINIQLMTILRLKAIKRPIPLICQIMSITMPEFDKILEEGKQRRIFLDKGELSSVGRRAYEEIRKKILINKYSKNSYMSNSFESVYLPVTFRGKI